MLTAVFHSSPKEWQLWRRENIISAPLWRLSLSLRINVAYSRWAKVVHIFCVSFTYCGAHLRKWRPKEVEKHSCFCVGSDREPRTERQDAGCLHSLVPPSLWWWEWPFPAARGRLSHGVYFPRGRLSHGVYLLLTAPWLCLFLKHLQIIMPNQHAWQWRGLPPFRPKRSSKSATHKACCPQ